MHRNEARGCFTSRFNKLRFRSWQLYSLQDLRAPRNFITLSVVRLCHLMPSLHWIIWGKSSFSVQPICTSCCERSLAIFTFCFLAVIFFFFCEGQIRYLSMYEVIRKCIRDDMTGFFDIIKGLRQWCWQVEVLLLARYVCTNSSAL